MDELGWTEDGKNLMLHYARQHISHMSLHSGPPEQANELPDGLYRRRQIDLREPNDGEMRSDKKVVFEVSEGSSPTHAGFWTEPFGGVLLARGRLSESHVFSGDGTLEIELATLDLNLESQN